MGYQVQAATERMGLRCLRTFSARGIFKQEVAFYTSSFFKVSCTAFTIGGYPSVHPLRLRTDGFACREGLGGLDAGAGLVRCPGTIPSSARPMMEAASQAAKTSRAVVNGIPGQGPDILVQFVTSAATLWLWPWSKRISSESSRSKFTWTRTIMWELSAKIYTSYLKYQPKSCTFRGHPPHKHPMACIQETVGLGRPSPLRWRTTSSGTSSAPKPKYPHTAFGELVEK